MECLRIQRDGFNPRVEYVTEQMGFICQECHHSQGDWGACEECGFPTIPVWLEINVDG